MGYDIVRRIRDARAQPSGGALLEELRREGFVVMHDIEQLGEGSVDHLVGGPSGVFLVETKLRGDEHEQLRKAKQQAAKLASALGVSVTPVVALTEQRERVPYCRHGVWIISSGQLLSWIRAQREPVVGVERLARFAALS